MRASNFYLVGKLAFRRHNPISLRGVLIIRKDTWQLVLAKTKDSMTSVGYLPASSGVIRRTVTRRFCSLGPCTGTLSCCSP